MGTKKVRETHHRAVPREENYNADVLVRLATSQDVEMLKVIPLKTLEAPFIGEASNEKVMAINDVNGWITVFSPTTILKQRKLNTPLPDISFMTTSYTDKVSTHPYSDASMRRKPLEFS